MNISTGADSSHDTAAGTAARLVSAALILVGGLIHLQLYFDGYRDVPNENLGRSFVLNGVASVALAAALVVRRDWWLRLAGIGLSVGTLAGFAMSRVGSGIFGFRESGLDPAPQGILTLAVEVLAIVLLAATFLPRVGAGTIPSVRAALPAVAAVVVVTIGMSVLWNRGGSSESASDTGAAPAVGAVAIAGFAFEPGDVTARVGDTITWTNDDTPQHTVVAPGLFASEDLGTGDAFSFTFESAGTYDYICGIHPNMAGRITVG